MKPVDQRRLAVQCDECPCLVSRGDCMTAVIASLLDLPYEDVPLFIEAGLGSWQWVLTWLARRGLTLRWVKRPDLPTGPVYACGKSPRGSFTHAVVWEGGPDGRIVHDPHPSRAGLAGEPTEFGVIVPAHGVCAKCGMAPT